MTGGSARSETAQIACLASPARAVAAVCALLIAATAPADAQILGRSMTAPHPFGVLLGDVFTLRTEVVVAGPYTLDRSALPKPGPVTYWLDLRSVTVRDTAGPSGATRYEIAAEYQTFYAPLEAIEQTVPPLKIVVTDGAGKRSEADGASWSFLTSPLRPVVLTAGGGAAYALRPDVEPVRKSLRPAQAAVAGAAAASLAALLLLAWSRAWPPFHRRRSRPFATAARNVSKLARGGGGDWRSAALALHRAFDAAAGRRLLGDDLSSFLSSRPSFQRHEPEIAAFFEASRRAFFGSARAGASPPAETLTRLSKDLAAAERAS